MLDELQGRIDEARGTRDRLNGLLEAAMSVGRELALPEVLRGIVEAAVVLVDAEYGALGVIGDDQGFRRGRAPAAPSPRIVPGTAPKGLRDPFSAGQCRWRKVLA